MTGKLVGRKKRGGKTGTQVDRRVERKHEIAGEQGDMGAVLISRDTMLESTNHGTTLPPQHQAKRRGPKLLGSFQSSNIIGS